MRAISSLFLISGALALAACGDSDDVSPDAGSRPDAAVTDSGAPLPDSGTSDGGVLPDSGVAPDGGPAPDGGFFDPTQGSFTGNFDSPGLTGFGARAEAMVRGPDQRLYVAGIFTRAGGAIASNVAVWTGEDWLPLGVELDGWAQTLAFDSSGTLWVGGEFSTSSLASWDGADWTLYEGALDGPVYDVAPIGDGLIVAGAFSSAGGAPAASIAHFDGVTWTPLAVTGTVAEIRSVVVTSSTSFCAGGGFESIGGVAAANVACWDSGVWTQLGDGLPGWVTELAVSPRGNWFAGGTLTFVTDPQTGDYRAGLAWMVGDGWLPYADGIDGGFINHVRAIEFDGMNGVYVGGSFGLAGHDGVPGVIAAQNIAYHDGRDWHELAGGVGRPIGVFSPSIVGVNDLLLDPDGTLWTGGFFGKAGSEAAVSIARFRNNAWSAVVPADAELFGVGGVVNDLVALPDGSLVAGGGFETVGSTIASNIARLDAEGWHRLGGGFDGTVRAVLYTSTGQLYAGGEFVSSAAMLMPFVARWEQGNWRAFGAELDGQVTSLIEGPDGFVYAGGDFTSAGGVTLNHVARWNGTAWTPVGEGFDGRVTSLTFDGDGDLVASGIFQNSGRAATRGIARWDGAAWVPFGGGANGGDFEYVSRVVYYGGYLYAAGAFTAIDGVAAPGLARWDGSTWEALGPLGSEFGSVLVSDVAPYGNGLFAGGTFNSAGNVPVSYLAWWDGTYWHSLDRGLGDLPERLLVVDHELWIGGGFTFINEDVPTVGLARWSFRP